MLSPPLALLAGLIFGLTLLNPFAKESRHVAQFLLQVSVVFARLRDESQRSAASRALGLPLLRPEHRPHHRAGPAAWSSCCVCAQADRCLITCGTAICGGSAIAAIAPVSDASEDEIAVSLGTVFTLNAVALLVFPAIGLALHLTQSQFGLWAALAIHDTSSVVGAAAKYGPQALQIGTTVKLVRALWIVPVALVIAAIVRHRKQRVEGGNANGRIAIPWFIGLFLLAAICRSYLHLNPAIWDRLNALGKTGLTTVLFLNRHRAVTRDPSQSGLASAAAGGLCFGS